MRDESLRGILVDHSLGELSPEVDELLEAYLETRPDRQMFEAAICETLSLTRAALASTHENKPGPLPLARFPALTRSTGQLWASARRWASRVAVAAALLLGFWIGHEAAPEPFKAPRHQFVKADPHHQRADQGGFWSVSRLSDINRRSADKRHNPLKWRSPVLRPSLEMNHES